MDMNQRGRNRKQTDVDNNNVLGNELLPSRAEYHGKKRKKKTVRLSNKKRMKISIPLILLLLLLMLPIGILSIINSGDHSKANPVSGSSGEEVSFETEDTVTEQQSAEEELNESDNDKLKEKEKEKDKDIDKEKPKESADQETDKDKEPVNNKVEPPGANENSENETQEEQSAENSEGTVKYHTVQPGENLFRIALKYYGSQDGVEKIKQANGMGNNEISVGQTLTIPQ